MTEPVRVDALRPGDKLDLEEDPFANTCGLEQITGEPCPDHDEDGKSITWRYEYGQVDELVRETPDCIRIDFTNGESIGFPPDHLVQRTTTED